MHELSRQQARQVAVRAQLLDAQRPSDVMQVARRLTLLQDDITAAVAPSAEIVVWSRLGDTAGADTIDAAVDAQQLVDLHGLLRPAEDLAVYRAAMAAWPGDAAWRQKQAEWVDANDDFRRDVLDELRRDGPLTRAELPDTCVVPWQSSGWNDNRNLVMLLEMLVHRGEVAVVGRRGREPRWDLAERVYPDTEVVPEPEATRIRAERRLAALGIARVKATKTPLEPDDVGDAGEAATVEGVKGRWRVDPAYLDDAFEGRTAILSPLDRLVFDRRRMVDLFGFDYQLEMYKPAAKRRWGYWAMPVLHGDELVGKVDARTDREARVLRVHAVHRDVPFTSAMDDALEAELDGLAARLGVAVLRDG
ncbi:DNA glycosylase AlkZ-like family protein [Jatrophihabitans fulvus]